MRIDVTSTKSTYSLQYQGIIFYNSTVEMITMKMNEGKILHARQRRQTLEVVLCKKDITNHTEQSNIPYGISKLKQSANNANININIPHRYKRPKISPIQTLEPSTSVNITQPLPPSTQALELSRQVQMG